MSHLVATKLRHLAGEFDDLKVRLRIALAGELARQVATAVGDVVRAVVGPPGSEPDRHWKPSRPDDPWDEDDEEYHPAYAPPIRPDESDQPESATTPVSANTSVAVAAGVHVARWWLLGRRGTLLGALGAGFGIGLAGLLGGPLLHSVLVLLATVGDLLSVSDMLGTGASRLRTI